MVRGPVRAVRVVCGCLPPPSTLPSSLFSVPCSLFSVLCSLFPVPCSLFPVPCSLAAGGRSGAFGRVSGVFEPLGDTPATFGDTPATFGDTPATFGDTPATLGDTPATLGDTPATFGDTPGTLGDTPAMLGDISGMLGDISGTLGDISGTLGDISGTLGDISGTLGDISGDLGDISAMLGDISGDLGDISGMLGDISGDLGDISGDLGDISGAVVLCVNTHDRPAERVYHPFMRSVFLVDDHAIVRRGLETELTETGRFRIAGEASTLAEARYLLEALREPPDLVILDLELGDDNGLDLIGALQERGGRLPAVLVCSVFEDPFRIQTALHAGARGYVPKSAAGAEILAAADAVLGGKTWLAPHLKLKNAAAPDIYDIFTRQERNVLELVLKGLGNAAIAKKLGVKLRTVENYLSRIYAKTGVTTRSGLIALFTARPPH